MPIYEYLCSSCGNKHEALQKISEDLLVDCPKCGAPSLEKMVTAAGFQLKGAGWYVTDFRDKKEPAATKSSPVSDGDSKASPSVSDAKNTNENKSIKESSVGSGD
ncbi:MAG: zinc ribbon domain-containing protein [Proteobacteria bacterium]|nr:zinc ribbon domain-containing protein [Pseudomonadota bacterium]